MPTQHPRLAHFHNLMSRMKSKIIRNVPLDIELCEYDCTKQQCLSGEWESCERRLLHVAGKKARCADPP